MPNYYAKHIAVTPFSDLILNGIKAVKNFDPNTLKKLTWPTEKNCRKTQSGDGGKIVVEDIRILWEDNQLIFPVSDVPQAVAEKVEANVIKYTGMFIAQLDGNVAYTPSDQNIEYYYILVENVDHKLNAVRFSPDETALLDPFVKHSMPIPARFGLDYTCIHRSSNAIESFLPDSVEPPLINMMKVDRSTPVAVGRIPQRHLDSGNQHLPKSFAKKLIPIEKATVENFQFGEIITDPNYTEEVTETQWPGSITQDGFHGPLEQDFQMTWIEKQENGGHERSVESIGSSELFFKGFSGSFAGDEGKPGVEKQHELGVYKANLLMTRPDGSFYLKPASTEVSYLMGFASPKHGNKGEPDEATLKAFVFHGGQAIRLPAFTWHTVPIPLEESAIFTEVVCASNANIAIDVLQETGHPLQFSQSV
ncbi:hypothetical protein M3Y95_00186800 [Aphelenchoides besseyi]|nr:hypothetical protein M3Y95_00186800 [Aphelenchoides besseyi]